MRLQFLLDMLKILALGLFDISLSFLFLPSKFQLPSSLLNGYCFLSIPSHIYIHYTHTHIFLFSHVQTVLHSNLSVLTQSIAIFFTKHNYLFTLSWFDPASFIFFFFYYLSSCSSFSSQLQMRKAKNSKKKKKIQCDAPAG